MPAEPACSGMTMPTTNSPHHRVPGLGQRDHRPEGAVAHVQAGGLAGLVAQLAQHGAGQLDQVQAERAGAAQRTRPRPIR